MFASFAHHLRTAFVLLDGHVAHWTALYQFGVKRDARLHKVRSAFLCQLPRVLLAGKPFVPGVLAVGAEVRITRGAVYAGRRALLPGTNLADGLAARTRTPRPVPVHVHLVVQSEAQVPVHHLRGHQGFHLADGDGALLVALGIGAGDVVSTFLNLELHVELHALENKTRMRRWRGSSRSGEAPLFFLC